MTIRTIVIPASVATNARALCKGLAGVAGDGMFLTGLSPTGNVPITNYISSGPISADMAALLPCTTVTKDKDGEIIPAGVTLSLCKSTDRIRPRPSGLLSVDSSLGIGGLPEGRMLIFHGGEGVGKTTGLNACFAEAQRRNDIAVIGDAEHKYDIRYAGICGVDVDKLVKLRPKTIEAGFDTMATLSTKLKQLDPDRRIVGGWDSLHSGIARKSERKGIDDDGGYSPESGAYSRSIRMLIPYLDETGMILICTSQVRMDVGSPQAGAQKIGVSKASLHHAVAIAKFEATRQKSASGKVDSQNVELTWVKNQCFDPFGIGRFRIVYGRGIDKAYSVFQAAKSMGLVDVSGSWVEVADGDESFLKAQGLEKAYEMMAEGTEVNLRIRAAVAKYVGNRLEQNHDLLSKLGHVSSDKILEAVDALDANKPALVDDAAPEAPAAALPRRSRRAR